MRGKNTREDRKQRKQNRKKASGSDTSLDSPNEDPEWFLTSPRKVATEISTFGYGFDMHPYMEELVYRGEWSSLMFSFCLVPDRSTFHIS